MEIKKMALCDNRCKSCLWANRFYATNSCGYVLYTGQPRGCEAGKNCTKYKHATPKEHEAMVRKLKGMMEREFEKGERYEAGT